MERKEFKHRRVDKIPLEASKKQLWSYIQKKVEKKQPWYKNFLNFFQLHTFSFSAAFAVILILAVVTYNSNISLIQPTEVKASFEMVANQQDSTGVEANTTFDLIPSENVSIEAIKENLEVNPKIEVDIKKTDEGFEILPAETLEPNQIYQFSIQSEVDGKPQKFSWTYQVKDTFKIINTLPGDKQGGVPLDTGIDINFSHENYDFENIQNFFEITPAVKGRFEKHYKTLSFIPQDSLEKSTIYKVTIKKGLKLNNSDQILAEDYQFEFSTLNEYQPEQGVQFQTRYYELAENKPIGLTVYNSTKENGQPGPIKVKIYQFAAEQDYLEVLKKQAEVPAWAYLSQEETQETDSLNLIGEVEALYDEKDWVSYIYLPTTELKKGYYLFEIQGSEPKSQALVQVTNLSSYLDITETQTLLWVNDVATGGAIEGANVEIIGHEEREKTNKEGIAVFETPEYLKDQQKPEILRISKNDQVLIAFLDLGSRGESYLKTNYWYSFSTDRPVYKSTDEVKFWGYLRPKNNHYRTDDLKITLTTWDEALIAEKKINLSKNNSFIGDFKLDKLPPNTYYLTLMQGEDVIAKEYLTVENYLKPAYQIKVDTDKKAVFAGEKLNFEISSNFFDGTPLPNLNLTYKDNWNTGEIKVDTQGKASMNTEAKPSEESCGDETYCSNQQFYNLTLSPKLAEETDIEGGASVAIFNSKLALDTLVRTDENQAHLEINSHFVDLEKFEEIGEAIGDFAPNRKVTGEITEITWKKNKTGEYYDFINKKVNTTYEYSEVKNPGGSFEILTDAKGKGEYQFKMKPESYYRVVLSSADEEGNETHETVYVYNGLNISSDYYSIRLLNSKSNPYQQPSYYELGEKVESAFSQNGESIPDGSKGKFLFLQSSNGLQEFKIQDNSHYSFDFDEAKIPNTFISGVWFTGENYFIAEGVNAAFEKDLKKLTIDVQANKATYEPGDKVELEVKVKDKDGKPVQAEVNLNLVDEAYYKVIYDALDDPLDDLYYFNDRGEIYMFDSHNNPLFLNLSGERGGCFVAGTQILMADGSYKNIEDIHAEDLILTKKSALSSEMVKAKVLKTISHQVDDYLIFNENLKVTKEHVIFVNGQFNLAGEVKIGDKLLNKDNQYIEIKSIREVREPVKVYNFEVENQHTYFANDFYVHNDKGGDGVRNDFEDNALFESIQTDVDGVGNLEFQLPDNITSWRVMAKAIDSKNLQAGTGVGSVPVSLPLFGDLIMNQEYTISDEPTVKLRAYGDALKPEDKITFKLSSKTLDLDSGELQGEAQKATYFDMPELKLGEHEILLESQIGDLKDAVSKPLKVVNSRLNKNILEFIPKVEVATPLKLAEEGATKISFVDGGRGLYYHDLMSLYFSEGDRLDQRISQLAAQELLHMYFQEDLPLSKEFNSLMYQNSDGSLRLMPYADSDLETTVLAILLDVKLDRFNQDGIKNYLNQIYQDKESNLDEIVLALTGLATLDEPVLTSLNLIQKEPKLTVKDQIYLALALEALGAHDEAQKAYKKLSKELENGNIQTDVRAIGAVLASALNDTKADVIWENVIKTKQNDEFLDLYQIGYFKNRLKFAESEMVKFKLTKNGKSEVVVLENGICYPALFLPQDQVMVEVLQGQLAATVHYTQKSTSSDFKNTEGLTIKRQYTVEGKEVSQIKEGDIVKINLEVFAGPNIPKKGGYRIEDILPSGLTPITPEYPASRSLNEDRVYPYQINKQEVNFYWYPVSEDSEGPDESFESVKTFSYLARVVNPGKFYADPAKIESFEDPAMASISQEVWIEIGRLED